MTRLVLVTHWHEGPLFWLLHVESVSCLADTVMPRFSTRLCIYWL